MKKPNEVSFYRHAEENPNQKLWEPFHSISHDGNWLIAAYCQPTFHSAKSFWILYKDPSLSLPSHPIQDLFAEAVRIGARKEALSGKTLSEHEEAFNSLAEGVEVFNTTSVKERWDLHVQIFMEMHKLLERESEYMHIWKRGAECICCKFLDRMEKIESHANVIVFATESDISSMRFPRGSNIEDLFAFLSGDRISNLKAVCSTNFYFSDSINTDNDLLRGKDPDEWEQIMRKFLGDKVSLIPSLYLR